jgi:assimilatory nitrate reductase catalytic subunit
MFRAWSDPEAAFRILQRVSVGTPCDFSGIDGYAAIAEAGGIQWPLRPQEAREFANERRLFEDGKFFTPDARARFVFEGPRALPEPVDEDFPLLLLTGRGSSAEWHTGTRTGRSDILRKLHGDGSPIEIHPDDAARLGLSDGERVVVESRRGSVTVRAFVTPNVPVGVVFLAMHAPEANALTHASFDPYSRQPSYKACAVSVRGRRACSNSQGAPDGARPSGASSPPPQRDESDGAWRDPAPQAPSEEAVR